MLCWIHEITSKDHSKSKDIRERANVYPIIAHVMKRRPSWYGQINEETQLRLHDKNSDIIMVIPEKD